MHRKMKPHHDPKRSDQRKSRDLARFQARSLKRGRA